MTAPTPIDRSARTVGDVLDAAGIDPLNRDTWPEPDRCADGLPIGPGGYYDGPQTPQELEAYRALPAHRYPRGGRRCRNRGRYDGLCGTHARVRADRLRREERDVERRAAETAAMEAARRLTAAGVPCDVTSGLNAGVRLDHTTAAILADRLAALPTPLDPIPLLQPAADPTQET